MIEQAERAFINTLSESDRLLLAKQQNLYRKMSRDERNKAERLTKTERERLAVITDRLTYMRGIFMGELPGKWARFSVTFTMRLPDHCNTDAVLNAMDVLFVDLIQQQAGKVVEISQPKLVGVQL